ncbi:Cep57 centrosome microtubule-binding domain-containing protein, putative [Babesia ovata]|uniref:Cep57 centrosome microtubule-binding domain-containing protein, putative n=1 Tax=Babesia ovata TaxID=189622 RepID=A0A2H6KD36_9APIC|nr:Cep57 centrosome microtubule-binding domain-containing protein, putative [Babesia ovata]GBE60910.1 Cep57 centrosome microtubule-binding domain-containing protein, putative [Babesia ovata]
MTEHEINPDSTDDEIDELEREVKRRLNAVGGLLKLRGVVSKEAYKGRFEEAKEAFDQISQHVARVQEKIDRELALLHQAKGVAEANRLQQLVVEEVHRQLQTSDTLRAISELRRSAEESKARILPRPEDAADNASTKNENREAEGRSTAAKPTTERSERPTHNNRPGSSSRSYSRNRDTFNRYIL